MLLLKQLVLYLKTSAVSKMDTAYLLLGSNMGNRLANIKNAIQKISQVCGDIVQLSSIYDTAAWGYTEQGNFLNQVVVLDSNMHPTQLMLHLLEIEKEIGRVRDIKYGPRLIDIDILLFDNEIINNSILTLPHPELQKRKFALMPLVEVASELIHPIIKQTITELLLSCTDTCYVQKFSEPSK